MGKGWLELYVKVKNCQRLGAFVAARFCAKRDVPFEIAHEIILGYPPRVL